MVAYGGTSDLHRNRTKLGILGEHGFNLTRIAVVATAAAISGFVFMRIRQRFCDDLEYFGISLDPARNAEAVAVISSDQSRVAVRIVETNEERGIARAGAQLRRNPS